MFKVRIKIYKQNLLEQVSLWIFTDLTNFSTAKAVIFVLFPALFGANNQMFLTVHTVLYSSLKFSGLKQVFTLSVLSKVQSVRPIKNFLAVDKVAYLL